MIVTKVTLPVPAAIPFPFLLRFPRNSEMVSITVSSSMHSYCHRYYMPITTGTQNEYMEIITDEFDILTAHVEYYDKDTNYHYMYSEYIDRNSSVHRSFIGVICKLTDKHFPH